METNEARVYLTGRSKSKDKMEDFLLVSLDLVTKMVWRAKQLAFDGGVGREMGTALLPLDGGVVVAGNYHRFWKLGDRTGSRMAVLPAKGEGFEAFLARYDDNGSLRWAQSSDTPGDDFAVALSKDDNDGALFLGNRIIGSGFGPYVSKVRLEGNESKNVTIVENNDTDHKFVWNPPKTLRLGDRLDSSYLSARSSKGENFSYSFDDQNISLGERPLITPDQNFTIMATSASFELEKKIKALKGQPHLDVEYEQQEAKLLFLVSFTNFIQTMMQVTWKVR